MSDVVGKATYETELDRTGLKEGLDAAKSEVEQSGKAAEQAANASAERSVSKFGQLGQAGIKAVSGAGVAAFSAMTALGNQAEAAAGRYQAATGASDAEAKNFIKTMDSLAGSSGAVGRSFDEIADVGTTVSQQFGVTGDKARDVTEAILEFSKVSKQDANEAAGQLEDTMTALGLSSDDTRGFLDTLIASSQKYGLDVGPQMLGTLQNIAPALQTMGLNANDAVGFVNALEAAGIPAQNAVKDLAGVIKDFPPGTTIDDVVAKLGAIEDPSLRSQAAVDLLGQKVGPQFALLVKPGMKSLDDFAVSAANADGSLSTAADNMVTSEERLGGVFDKLIAGARDISTEFGPALLGIANTAVALSPFVTKLGGVLDQVKGPLLAKARDIGEAVLPQLFGVGSRVAADQIAEAGEGIGEALGEAINAGAGDAVAEGAEGTIIGNLSADALKKGAGGAGTKIGISAGEGVAAGLGGAAATAAVSSAGLGVAATLGLGVAAGLATSPILPMLLDKLTGNDPSTKLYAAGQMAADHFMEGASAQAKAQFTATFFTAVNTQLENRSLWDKVWNNGMGAAIDAGVLAAQAYSGSVAAHLPDDTREAFAQANLSTIFANDQALAAAGIEAGKRIGGAIPPGIATGVDSKWSIFAATMQRFVPALHETMLAVHREAAWGGAQTPGEYGQGLRSEFHTAKDVIGDLRELMKHTLSPAAQEAELIGIATHKKLAKALRDGRPEVRAEGQQIALDTIAQLHRLDATSPEIGRLTTKLLAGAAENEKPALRDAIAAIVGVADTQLNRLPSIARESGAEIPRALADGIDRTHGVFDRKLEWLTRKADDFLSLHSPAKRGPWSERGGPMAWARGATSKIAQALAGGLEDGGADLDAAWASITGRTAAFLAPSIRPLGLAASIAGPGGASSSFNGHVDDMRPQSGSAQAVIHNHFHIGTLIADESGLAELGQRIDQAQGYTNRSRQPLGGAY